jgi:hypothetical protein
MTVGELRKIADGIDHEAVDGHATMHKSLCLPCVQRSVLRATFIIRQRYQGRVR